MPAGPVEDEGGAADAGKDVPARSQLNSDIGYWMASRDRRWGWRIEGRVLHEFECGPPTYPDLWIDDDGSVLVWDAGVPDRPRPSQDPKGWRHAVPATLAIGSDKEQFRDCHALVRDIDDEGEGAVEMVVGWGFYLRGHWLEKPEEEARMGSGRAGPFRADRIPPSMTVPQGYQLPHRVDSYQLLERLLDPGVSAVWAMVGEPQPQNGKVWDMELCRCRRFERVTRAADAARVLVGFLTDDEKSGGQRTALELTGRPHDFVRLSISDLRPGASEPNWGVLPQAVFHHSRMLLAEATPSWIALVRTEDRRSDGDHRVGLYHLDDSVRLYFSETACEADLPGVDEPGNPQGLRGCPER